MSEIDTNLPYSPTSTFLWSPNTSISHHASSPLSNIMKKDGKMSPDQDKDDDIEYYETSIFDFKVPTHTGSECYLKKYAGKKLYLVINVSAFGINALADENYFQLQNLYDKYNKNLEILAFPSEDFSGETNQNINRLISDAREKGITFPIFGKIHCDSSIYDCDIHPLYEFLTHSSQYEGPIEWNFAKFLCDSEGVVIHRYASYFAPKNIENDIVSILMRPEINFDILPDTINPPRLSVEDHTDDESSPSANPNANPNLESPEHQKRGRLMSFTSRALSIVMKSSALVTLSTDMLKVQKYLSPSKSFQKSPKTIKTSPRKVYVIG